MIEPPQSSDARVEVRAATRADAQSIQRLVVALAAFEKLPPPDAEAQERLIEDAFGPKQLLEIAVADLKGEVIGYAFFFETYSTFLARPTLYLEDLFVLPEYRGQRVGYALFTYCAREAARRGCGRMDWAVLDWNTHALRFYDKLGAAHLHDWQLYRLEGPALAAFDESVPSTVL